jgi:hypothetical protein
MFNSCGERGDFVGIGGAGYGSNNGNPLVDMFSQRHGIDHL